jgi:hypothetical protein
MTSDVSADADKFLAELAWREFSYYLLFHFGDLADRNFRPAFGRFPWNDSKELLRGWQRGRTGYPIVDAGLRELWVTGWMPARNSIHEVTMSAGGSPSWPTCRLQRFTPHRRPRRCSWPGAGGVSRPEAIVLNRHFRSMS